MCRGNNGQITLTASGGTAPYQYSKNNGSTYQPGNQFTNLGAGTYQVILKDANNCVTPAQAFTITQPATLSVVIGKTNVTTCSGATNGSISVTATGGSGSYQYSRDNGATYQTSSTFSDLAAGPYQVVVKDGNNCTTTAQTITITQPAVVTLSLSKTNVTTCFGANTGSISLTASGGTGAYQYSIDNGSNFQPGNQFTNLPAGIYQVVAKDANSCLSTTQSTTISQPSALSATTTATPVSCYSGTNGSISVQVTGGTAPYRYSITDGSSYQTSNQFTGLSAGTYHIIVRDANNCLLDAPTTEVTQPDAVTFSISQTDVACSGGNSGSITVSASGGSGLINTRKTMELLFRPAINFRI
ncbi:hypothetical protein GO730_01440 [Spirosoma sp. HMF3257]|uniref:SprB repeat-containing protein n=1 Tax=Spirosoma telluris TaxID=2183553 RepID=A0A327NER6_9BACT|nr:hypothetical protein [Spirosoma telluris]RAI73425.1 hypothetical protein HMF3257_01410 [Spirosoma telluris]